MFKKSWTIVLEFFNFLWSYFRAVELSIIEAFHGTVIIFVLTSSAILDLINMYFVSSMFNIY